MNRATHPLGCILGTLFLFTLSLSGLMVFLGWSHRNDPDPETAAAASGALSIGLYWLAASGLLLGLTALSFRFKTKISRDAPY